jgi:hypothetical protein
MDIACFSTGGPRTGGGGEARGGGSSASVAIEVAATVATGAVVAQGAVQTAQDLSQPAAVESSGSRSGGAYEIDNNSDDAIPTSPVGKLTERNRNYWKKQGVNPEKIKEPIVGRAGAGYDVYTDTKGNVWVKRKGETDDKAIYAGKHEEVITDPEHKDDRVQERDRGRGR